MSTGQVVYASTLERDVFYLVNVLGLEAGQTEEELDDKIKTEARALGVDIDSLYDAKPESPRRSESITSLASQSTGLTSNCSDGFAQDQQPGVLQRRRSRASLSFKDYDTFLSHGVRSGRSSLSFSTPSTPSQSAFSLPLYSHESPPKKNFRRIRGLNMLRLGRSDENGLDHCSHCPRGPFGQRRATHRLPCGHRLCATALRTTIKNAGATEAVPSCCSVPISGELVEQVMDEEERTAFLDKLEQWDEAMSIASSAQSDRRPSIAQSIQSEPRLSMAPSLHSDPRASINIRRPAGLSPICRTASDESKADSLEPRLGQEQEWLRDRADYKQLRDSQTQLRDRAQTWIENHRVTLETAFERCRDLMRSRQESAIEDLLDRHNIAMSEAEDKQVKAEADMRDMHEKEARDTATALRHMEAYCAGTYSTGDLHHRPVTAQDRAELDKARRARDTLCTKHAAAINILRGEQGRRIRFRVQRQEKELQELRRAQRIQELEVERSCTAEMLKFEAGVAQKKARIRARWELQMAILARRATVEKAGLVVPPAKPDGQLEWCTQVDWLERDAGVGLAAETNLAGLARVDEVVPRETAAAAAAPPLLLAVE